MKGCFSYIRFAHSDFNPYLLTLEPGIKKTKKAGRWSGQDGETGVGMVSKSNLLERQEIGPGQNGETGGVDLVRKSDLLRRQEGGPGQDGETGVDLVSKSDLLRRQEGGPGQDGETGVDLARKSDLLRRQEGGLNPDGKTGWSVKATYSKGRKVVLGSIERQVLIW